MNIEINILTGTDFVEFRSNIFMWIKWISIAHTPNCTQVHINWVNCRFPAKAFLSDKLKKAASFLCFHAEKAYKTKKLQYLVDIVLNNEEPKSNLQFEISFIVQYKGCKNCSK